MLQMPLRNVFSSKPREEDGSKWHLNRPNENYRWITMVTIMNNTDQCVINYDVLQTCVGYFKKRRCFGMVHGDITGSFHKNINTKAVCIQTESECIYILYGAESEYHLWFWVVHISVQHLVCVWTIPYGPYDKCDTLSWKNPYGETSK